MSDRNDLPCKTPLASATDSNKQRIPSVLPQNAGQTSDVLHSIKEKD